MIRLIKCVRILLSKLSIWTLKKLYKLENIRKNKIFNYCSFQRINLKQADIYEYIFF